jgi:hypothetical protein
MMPLVAQRKRVGLRREDLTAETAPNKIAYMYPFWMPPCEPTLPANITASFCGQLMKIQQAETWGSLFSATTLQHN